MTHSEMQTKFVCSLLALVAMMMTGCQSSTSNNMAQHVNALTSAKKNAFFQQLIIKFKPNTIACDADGVARLSSSTGVQIEYVRMMSGQACVIRQFSDKEDGFFEGQILLRRHPDVEWVELDAIRKAL
jgi:hypothetical protein